MEDGRRLMTQSISILHSLFSIPSFLLWFLRLFAAMDREGTQ